MTSKLLIALSFLITCVFSTHYRETPHNLSQKYQEYNLGEESTRDYLVANGLRLRPGETVKISIAENPSTGFQWQIDQSATNGFFTI